MARPKTDFRNEVKTRVRDATYDALQQYMRDNRCASEARAPNVGICGPETPGSDDAGA